MQYLDLEPKNLGVARRNGCLQNQVNQVKVQRQSFLDFFPNTKTKFPGYIKQDIFLAILKKTVQSAVDCVKDQDQETPKYYFDLFKDLIFKVICTEWRRTSELHEGDKMKAQSNSYLINGITDIVSLGVGLAVNSKFEKPIKNSQRNLYRYSNTDKFLGNGKLGNIVNKLIAGDMNYKGVKVVKNLMDISLDTFINKSSKFSITLVGSCVTKNREFEDKFNIFGTGKGAQIADIATDVLSIQPHFGMAKSIVSGGFNIALGIHNGIIANRIKKNEDKTNQAEIEFNQRLKNAILSDFESLNPKIDLGKAIQELIEVLKCTL